MNDVTWYVTFGFDHVHPFTHESLTNCYVKLTGTESSVRERMIARFGRNWAFLYRDPNIAGIERYNLREIMWIDSVFKDQ